MEKSQLFLLFLFPFFTQILSHEICKPDYCNSFVGPEVRFPFRLIGRRAKRCGFPGFDLFCNHLNQTIVKLQFSGEFIVDDIDYAAQSIYINDPKCLPRRMLNFSLAGSVFRGVNSINYTFLNCSGQYPGYISASRIPLYCLSDQNYTVMAMSLEYASPETIPSYCREIANVSIPWQWYGSEYWSPAGFRRNLELTWKDPGCWDCEAEGGICGYKNDKGPEIGCFMRSSSRGIPRSAKYGIIIGVGIPGLVCLIGFACYACGLIRAFSIQHRFNVDLPITTISDPPVLRTNGLDGPTIASYPKTVLGDSRRLPNPDDGTCPICLSEYQPKEELRTIPECNHYFHADCIDEWLKLNATCPLCRNSPESSVGTPCSSILSHSSSASSTTIHH